MKFIFYSIYDLDPIKIENSEDVSYFILEQQKVKRSILFIEMVNKLLLVTLDLNLVNAFILRSRSNHLYSTMPALNVNTNSQ